MTERRVSQRTGNTDMSKRPGRGDGGTDRRRGGGGAEREKEQGEYKRGENWRNRARLTKEEITDGGIKIEIKKKKNTLTTALKSTFRSRVVYCDDDMI